MNHLGGELRVCVDHQDIAAYCCRDFPKEVTPRGLIRFEEFAPLARLADNRNIWRPASFERLAGSQVKFYAVAVR
jgi:hypothetical protein